MTGIVLLAPAISPRYSCDAALARTERGIWNFYSVGDMWFLGLLTLVFGTSDGRHSLAAGCTGFVNRDVSAASTKRSLRQIPYRFGMISQFNFGGHFGCVHRDFVAQSVAPILREGSNEDC